MFVFVVLEEGGLAEVWQSETCEAELDWTYRSRQMVFPGLDISWVVKGHVRQTYRAARHVNSS